MTETTTDMNAWDASNMVDVFISYNWSHQDLVKALRDELKACGHSVWMDIDFMGGGQHLYREIAKGLHATKVVLCIVTKKYLNSPNCALEVNYAFDLHRQGKLAIIPLVVEDLHLTEEPGDIGFLMGGMLYVDFKELSNDNRNWKKHPNFEQLKYQLARFLTVEVQEIKNGDVKVSEVQIIGEKVDKMGLLESAIDPLPDGLDEIFEKFDISRDAIEAMRKDELLDVDLLRDLPDADIESYGKTRGMQLKLRKLLKHLKEFQDQPAKNKNLMADVDILKDQRLLELSSKLIKESHTLCALLGLSNDTYDALITSDKITNGLSGVNMELFQRWLKKKDDGARKSVAVAKKLKKTMSMMKREDLAATIEEWIVKAMKGKAYEPDDDDVYQLEEEDDENAGVVVTDIRLREIAKKVSGNEMELGLELGLDYADIQNYILNYRRVEDRVFTMLFEWNRSQTSSEKEKKEELMDVFLELKRKDIKSMIEKWRV